jgi:segregation and condensation protein A
MPTATATAPTLEAYQLCLPTFEGPFDVLLRLIEREQLPVSEVSLLAVFDQFMAFLASLESPAPEVIADFATVAGRLSLLKSRALLPRPVQPSEDEPEIDLVRQLAEYRAVKAAADLLDGRQRAGIGAFVRGETISLPEAEPGPLAPQPATALTRALRRWLVRVPAAPVAVPSFRVVTLREMTARILDAIGREGRVSFTAIGARCRSRQEVAVAFLAMLTMIRRHTLVATQDELFGPISLARGPISLLSPPSGEISDEAAADVG